MSYTENLSRVLAGTESLYNVDPGLINADNLFYAEDVEIDAQEETLARTGETPYAPGIKPVMGATVSTVALSTELGAFPVSSGSEVPPFQPILIAGGCVRTESTGGANEYIQYARASAGHGSARFEHYMRSDDGSTEIVQSAGGVRGNLVLKVEGNGRWMVSLNGQGASGSIANTGSGPGTNDYDSLALCADTAVGARSIARIYVEDDSLNYFSLTGAYVHSAEVDFGFDVQPKQALGAREIQLVPGVMTGRLMLDALNLTTWDPRAIKTARKTVRVSLFSSDLSWNVLEPTDSGSYILFDGTFVIESAKLAKAAGERVWDLSLVAAFPQVSSDGGGVRAAENGLIRCGTYTAP